MLALKAQKEDRRLSWERRICAPGISSVACASQQAQAAPAREPASLPMARNGTQAGVDRADRHDHATVAHQAAQPAEPGR